MTRQRTVQVLLSLLFWIPTIIFLKVAGEVVEKEPSKLDISIIDWLHTIATPWLTQFFIYVTNAGGIISVLIMSLLILLMLVKKRMYAKASFFAIGVGGAVLANISLKLLFQRDRPSLWDASVVETGFSFPSGHAMASAALACCLVVLLWHTKWRWVSVIVGIFVMFLIGISRPYLGVHYPSDILAGWCVSIAWVSLVSYFMRRSLGFSDSASKKLI